MKKMMWLLTCTLTFVLVFSGSALIKLKFPTFSNPLQVDWNESVGTIYTDLVYGEEELNNYDLYVPADQTKDSYGLVVYLHAGGFTGGDKSEDAEMLKYFASKGYVAAGVNYSLRTDENTANLYQMSEEIKQSIPVIQEKAAELGYHLDQMAISGGSAGGALALLYAYRDADTSPIPVKMVFEGVGPPSFEPSLWLGIDDSDNPYESNEAAEAGAGFASIMTGEDITVDMMRNGEYKKYVDEISPYTHITENSVPTLAAYGTYDKVVPFGLTRNFLKALEDNHVPHDFIEFKRSGHGLQNDRKEAKLYTDKINEYLDKYMPN
ncbi:alpha/beta hydrolase [Paenibacillus sp. ACRSA]|uniref:alpha/beta hydrolase n=1 Tax=Paenibacillus sp. ACRSA TaxID=2918211 RepID=UPI001EF53E69|nr:alpha/beta hydrolase [Paenibacillus sp. ACRSA]MCG7378800.1 alpha/beta hydrolase [Paenibacillus sp. ACRSA]